MSLLLDALDRAERARREQRQMGQPEPTLEAMGKDAPPAPLSSEPALLLPAPGRADPARRARLLLLGGLLASAAGVVGWLGWSLQSSVGAPVAPAPGPVVAALSSPVPAPAGATAAATRAAGISTGASVAPPLPRAADSAQLQPGRPADGRVGAEGSTAGAIGSLTGPGPATAGSGRSPARILGHATGAERSTAGGGYRQTGVDGSIARAAPEPAGAAGPAGVTSAPGVDVRLFRSGDAARVDPALQGAWSELHDGHLDAARRAYQQLEQRQPANLDVQLGLGRLAAEQGAPEEARRHYRRALELDPRNATARAGLAVLEPGAGDRAVDSDLRSRSAGEPDAQLALASHLSAAGQWPEAEQAWFEALNGHPGDPDLLYNLAIALDHLGQSAAARRHYQQALDAMASRPAHFSRPQVEQRIQALEAP